MLLLITFLLGAMSISFLCSILESVLLSTPMSFVTMKEDEGYKPATQRMVWSGIGHYNDSDIGLYRNYPEDAGHRELAKPDGLHGQNHSRAHLLALPRCGDVTMAYTPDFTKERR